MSDLIDELEDIFDDIPIIEAIPEEYIKKESLDHTYKNSLVSAEYDLSLIEKLRESNKNMAEKANERIDNYLEILNQKIYFINEELTATIPFCRDNMYLMMSQSGCGKSTIVANISHSLFKQQKKTLIISNEEGAEDCLMRIACLELGFSFNFYKKGRMPKKEVQQCKELFPQITEHVQIFGLNEEGMSPTDIDDVISILEGSLKYQYSAILIDYYQLVRSRKNSQQTTYEILDDLRLYFQKFMKKSQAPLVVMCQLYSSGKRKSLDVDARLKNNSNILETASVAIEIVPDFAEKSTTFKINKDRFGSTGKDLKFFFKNGSYIPYKDVTIEDKLGLENFDNVVVGDIE